MTLKQFYEKFKEKHQLTLIAGEKGIHASIEGIYLLEDLNNIKFLRDRGLIITTGLANHYDDYWLEELLCAARRKSASGVILCMGAYITEIPLPLVEYCNYNNLPLLVIPWDIYIVDIMQEYYDDFFKEKQQGEYFGKIFSNAMFNNTIDNEFIADHEDMKPYSYSTYGIVAFKNVAKDTLTAVLNQTEEKYLILTKKTTLYAILYNITESNFSAAAALLHMSLSTEPVHYGIATLGQGIHSLFNKRIEADKALQVAMATRKTYCCYNELGLYRIILGIADGAILDDLYTQSLKPVVDYDNEHNSNYLEILRYYIEFNSSVQRVAEHTFAHRNTVNYSIGKIKKILQSDLSSMEERCRIQLAFCLYDLQQ
ncbi:MULTISPECIES: PucR family transcriptional regulator ligand-binding domain-containing protein [Sporomusa]|uniref:PucR family transcriptional regulator n=1 Tax=Sporomusa TaxID=2375 RepID=UPI00315918A1